MFSGLALFCDNTLTGETPKAAEFELEFKELDILSKTSNRSPFSIIRINIHELKYPLSKIILDVLV